MEDTTWIHNLDPFIIDPFLIPLLNMNFPGVRWYGLAYFTGFVAGFFIIRWMAERKLSPMKVEKVADFITYIILGVMIGGRLGYVFFYSPELLTEWNSDFPFWGALAVHKGGMASHGGMIGVVVACILFGKRHKMSPLHVGDLSILGASIGIFLGRIANFINGELMGRVAESKIAWAVKFPQDMHRWINFSDANWAAQYKAKLMELSTVVPELGISGERWKSWVSDVGTYIAAKSQNLGNAELSSMYHKIYLPARDEIHSVVYKLLEAPAKGNEALTKALGTVLEARHPSQLYAALSEGLIPFLFIIFLWRKPLKPGVIGGAFLTLYPISRIINEQFRLPDAHIGYQLFGLTRGQWLSIVMFFMAGGYLLWCMKRDVAPIGGWANMQPPSDQPNEEENEAKQKPKKANNGSSKISSTTSQKKRKKPKKRKIKK